MKKFKEGDLVLIKGDEDGLMGIVSSIMDFPGEFEKTYITVQYDECGPQTSGIFLPKHLEYLDHIDPVEWNESAAYGQSTIFIE